MHEKAIVKCPLCGSDSTREIIKPKIEINDPVKLYGAADGVTGTQRIVECLVCEMIYENPRLPIKVILEGYAGSHGGSHDSQHEMRIRSFAFALKRNKKYLPPKNSIVLDIGTAGGAFLEAANIFGYKTFGLEPSIDLVNRGKTRGLNVFHGSIENNMLQNKKFDLICFWDVLEHVANPREALQYAIKLLNENGILLINFPNIGTTQARLAGKKFWWIISVHLVHFTNKTLDKLCLTEGLIPVRKKRYWQILELGYLIELSGKLGVPLLSKWVKFLPKYIRKFPFLYYASQTTAIYKKNL